MLSIRLCGVSKGKIIDIDGIKKEIIKTEYHYPLSLNLLDLNDGYIS